MPGKFIGVGEKLDDLEPFDADAYVEALFESEMGAAGFSLRVDGPLSPPAE
jgi:hypothetical protein